MPPTNPPRLRRRAPNQNASALIAANFASSEGWKLSPNGRRSQRWLPLMFRPMPGTYTSASSTSVTPSSGHASRSQRR